MKCPVTSVSVHNSGEPSQGKGIREQVLSTHWALARPKTQPHTAPGGPGFTARPRGGGASTIYGGASRWVRLRQTVVWWVWVSRLERFLLFDHYRLGPQGRVLGAT